MMNFILPLRAVSTRIGTSCGSRGPKMPWGRMAAVRKPFSLSQASRTSWNKDTRESGDVKNALEERRKRQSTLSLSDLFLLNLGLRVIVDGLLGIRQVLFAILYIFAFKHHAGTAGQNQFLLEANSGNDVVLVRVVYMKRRQSVRRMCHLHSGLQARLNDRARALNVDPLKQSTVVTGRRRRSTVEDQRRVPQGGQQSLEDQSGGN